MKKLTTILIAFTMAPVLCTVSAMGATPKQDGSQVETLDRIVATIAGIPFTQSDLIHEYKIEELITGRPVTAADAAPAASTLPRFIDQRLLESELASYHFNSKSIATGAKKQLDAIRNRFKSESGFENALRSSGVNENQLISRIEEQQKIMAMIDMRLRPFASVSAKDIARYYHQILLPAFSREDHGPAPSLPAVEAKIREILVQKEINQLLDGWLLELRKERGVEILGN
ncbi:MAG: hypothetical protein KGM47_02010 [Acidobacteriota bacterium]|nr:hypothetical protein [Acidobacteriota bacterium]